jgi:hypothetical protein
MKDFELTEEEIFEKTEEFYNFLQGEIPKSISIEKENDKIKLDKEKAFLIIWYLQEHYRIIPDNIEKCNECSELFNIHSQGGFCEKFKIFYCCSEHMHKKCEYVYEGNCDDCEVDNE